MEGFNDYLEEDLGLDAPVEEIIDNEPIKSEDDDFFGTQIDKNTNTNSILEDFLKERGILDSKVKIVDENNEEQEISFYDLSREEQMEILNSSEPTEENDLDDSEIDLINHLRTNNLSVEDFLAQYREAILAETQTAAEPSYDIDAYDDQELFLLDLKNKYDLTDEELQAELEKELVNEELFTKKVTKLRAEYKQLEDQYKTQQEAEFEAQRNEQYSQFANTMVDIATNVSDYHGVALEDNEKSETLSYLLDLDESGSSKFYKDLNDPQKLYEAAWYLRYGAEAFKALENAYEAEIAKLKKEDKPRVVVRNSRKEVNSIYDLD